MQDDLFYKVINKAKKKMKSAKAGQSPENYLIKEYCKMFKYTLECTGKVPVINLKVPQMSCLFDN